VNEPRIERAFLTLPGRQVHYRRSGSGPPVVLLHQSPKSSEELIPLIRLLAPYFTVLAPDTPGYGLSDPIAAPDAEPEIDAFADAVAAFLDGTGLRQVGLYGLHTGAAIATRFAARYPDRVAALVANGTLIKTAEERADMLAHYLPRFEPKWDGSHLAWAWSRMREQLLFFPWYRRDPTARVAIPVTIDGLQANLLALLDAGDNYRTAYRTAFAYAAEEDLKRMPVPARFVCAEPDPLYRYLDRFPPLPANAAIARVPDAAAAMRFAVSYFRETISGQSPALPATASVPHRASSRIVQVGESQLHVRLNTDAPGRPVIILHDIGASSRGLTDLIGGFIGRRPVYAPDLPGHGDSDPADAEGSPLADAVARLSALHTQLAIPAADVIALGASAAIAAAWAESAPAEIASLTLCNPAIAPESRLADFDRHYAPPLTPDWAGGHLLRAWHQARDKDLFWPWFDTSAAAILPEGVPASDVVVQQRVIDLFKSESGRARLAAAAFREPPSPRLSGLTAPVWVAGAAGWPEQPGLSDLPRRIALPARIPNWSDSLLDAWAANCARSGQTERGQK
jgi:pimeloyl-ACP methyl ester carboxylesterase